MFEFLRIQYILGRIGEEELRHAVSKGWMTEEQKTKILNAE